MFKQGGYFIGGNYFHRKLHLRFLKRFWIPCCPVNHKNNQTASGKCKPHGNFKASYISVLNHWKIFETTLNNGIKWTESNNSPTNLALLHHPRPSWINNLIFIYYYSYLMHVFTILLKFSQIFSYDFMKFATVFCFNLKKSG